MCAEYQYNFFLIYHDRYQKHCTVVTFQCKLLLRLKFDYNNNNNNNNKKHKKGIKATHTCVLPKTDVI